MRFLKDGTERVVLFATAPEDHKAITITEWDGAEDLSGSIVKPLSVNFADSERFNFATIDVEGNGERRGRTNMAGTLRVVREYDEANSQPDATADSVFAALKTPGSELRLGIYRGPKLYAEAMAAGDEYDYGMFQTDVPRVVEETDTYIAYDVPLIFMGEYAAQEVLAAAA